MGVRGEFEVGSRLSSLAEFIYCSAHARTCKHYNYADNIWLKKAISNVVVIAMNTKPLYSLCLHTCSILV